MIDADCDDCGFADTVPIEAHDRYSAWWTCPECGAIHPIDLADIEVFDPDTHHDEIHEVPC